MRALRWHARRDVRLEDVPEPAPPGRGEVLISVEWCGLCGTDVEEYTDGPLVIPSEPHPLTGHSSPMIIGHEVSGRVLAAGPGAGLDPGTLVALDGYLYCGRCPACHRHEVNLCEVWAHIGMSEPGGLAERMVVPAAMAIPATSPIRSDHLALAEPFAVAVHGLRRANLAAGEHVAVIGAGTIGLAVLQVARFRGAATLAAVDPITSRRSLAGELGADRLAADIAALVDQLPGGVDLVVDCSGADTTPNAAIELARPGGRILMLGFPPRPGTIDYTKFLLKELDLIASVGHIYDEDFATAVRLLCEGHVRAEELISHRIPIERAVQDGIELLAGPGRAETRKILVHP